MLPISLSAFSDPLPPDPHLPATAAVQFPRVKATSSIRNAGIAFSQRCKQGHFGFAVGGAKGELGASEAAELSKLIETFVRAVEATELEQRLLNLEQRFK